MAIAIQMRASPAGQGVAPSEAVFAIAARGKAPTLYDVFFFSPPNFTFLPPLIPHCFFLNEDSRIKENRLRKLQCRF
jgi:hypothetical protein